MEFLTGERWRRWLKETFYSEENRVYESDRATIYSSAGITFDGEIKCGTGLTGTGDGV